MVQRWIVRAVAAASLGLAGGAAQAMLVSIDFGTSEVTQQPVGTTSPSFSGVETVAAGLNAGFGAANVWNALLAPEYSRSVVTNPSFWGLKDSTGAATGIGLSLTGGVKGFSGFNNQSADALRKDYLFFNSGNNPATTLDWMLNGLDAGALYALVFYSSNVSAMRDWTMDVANAGGGSQFIEGLSGVAYYSSIMADATGKISGSLLRDSALDEEVNWAGMQLLRVDPAGPVSVPVPATLPLVAVGLLALGATVRCRTQQR